MTVHLDAVQALLNEVDSRIEHGANSNGHLEYVRHRLREIDIDATRSRVAEWLFKRVVNDERNSDMRWHRLDPELRRGWLEEADRLIAAAAGGR